MPAFLIVFDSVGIGAAPDAADYGDAGAATLPHCAQAVNGLALPALQVMGLGNITALLPDGLPIEGVPPAGTPTASWGAMRERSRGKDTTTGHWEMAGLHLEQGFHLFPAGPPSFPADLLASFREQTGRGVLGDRAASGTVIIQELGEEQMRSGDWIVYTSADSVFQIAAHETVIPLDELYRGCEIARELCDPLVVGRVIARPFIGDKAGAFTRTENRRDFSLPPPEPTVLDRLLEAGTPVITVGKLDDVFTGRGISQSIHVENNRDAEAAVLELAADGGDAFVFANLIDFDMLYGHRRDADGYAGALRDADRFIGELLPSLNTDDVLLITADHGNDPTFRGTDHTREYVPLLCYRPGQPGESLGVRDGFYDIAQSLTTWFGIEPMTRGVAFL